MLVGVASLTAIDQPMTKRADRSWLRNSPVKRRNRELAHSHCAGLCRRCAGTGRPAPALGIAARSVRHALGGSGEHRGIEGLTGLDQVQLGRFGTDEQVELWVRTSIEKFNLARAIGLDSVSPSTAP